MLLPPPSSPVGGSTHSITTAGVGGDPSVDGGGFGLIAVDTIDDADGDDDDVVTAVDGGGLETEVGTTGDVGGGGGGLLGHPVTPAKQLWVTSEHSRRDPPGHGSQTDLALEEDTPHYGRVRNVICRQLELNMISIEHDDIQLTSPTITHKEPIRIGIPIHNPRQHHSSIILRTPHSQTLPQFVHHTLPIRANGILLVEQLIFPTGDDVSSHEVSVVAVDVSSAGEGGFVSCKRGGG